MEQIGIKGTNKLGRTSPKSRFSYPAGHRVFKFTCSRFYNAIRLLNSEQFQGGALDVIGCKNTGSFYGEGKSLVYIKIIKGEYASRAWSTPGPSPRLDVRAFNWNVFDNNNDLVESDVLEESLNCDEANQKISRSVISQKIKTVSTSASVAPTLTIEIETKDDPTIETVCLQKAETEIIIILPKEAVTGAKAPQINTSKLYELIDGEFTLIDSFN